MEVFEVHITGSENIHQIAKGLGLKTIAIDLLQPDMNVLRVEHMTSHIYRFENFERCGEEVIKIVNQMRDSGVVIHRVKVESPDYQHYRTHSLYMESHFEAEGLFFPLSRTHGKEKLLATDRTYDQSRYDDFVKINKGRDLELCLWDTCVEEDLDWFECYPRNSL